MVQLLRRHQVLLLVLCSNLLLLLLLNRHPVIICPCRLILRMSGDLLKCSSRILNLAYCHGSLAIFQYKVFFFFWLIPLSPLPATITSVAAFSERISAVSLSWPSCLYFPLLPSLSPNKTWVYSLYFVEYSADNAASQWKYIVENINLCGEGSNQDLAEIGCLFWTKLYLHKHCEINDSNDCQ